jgi:FAD:protein FMN transferase
MGVDVEVAGAAPDEFARVRALFVEWERVFSRFRPDSELWRVNEARSRIVAVSPLFAHVTSAALRAAADTEGLVDPTLGVAIEAAGYDRDFELLAPDWRPADPTARGQWRDIRLARRLLRRPPGVRLDLNGVVKALAVDEALGLIDGAGFVAAGGDLVVRGEADVGLPSGGSVRLRDGALATSGTTKRRWVRGGRERHHLIDPRTGRPAESCWAEVTVAAQTCLDADVAAKAAFLLSEDGPAWLDARGLAGLFVGDEVVRNDCWKQAA